MRYIKRLTTKYGSNTKFEIVENTSNPKVVCVCQNDKDARQVLRAYNSAERNKEYRERKQNE